MVNKTIGWALAGVAVGVWYWGLGADIGGYKTYDEAYMLFTILTVAYLAR